MLLQGRIYYVDGGDFITIEGRLYYARGETFSWRRLYHVTPDAVYRHTQDHEALFAVESALRLKNICRTTLIDKIALFVQNELPKLFNMLRRLIVSITRVGR